MCYKPLHEPICYASSLKSYETGPHSSYVFSEDGMRNEKGSRWATSRHQVIKLPKGAHCKVVPSAPMLCVLQPLWLNPQGPRVRSQSCLPSCLHVQLWKTNQTSPNTEASLEPPLRHPFFRKTSLTSLSLGTSLAARLPH